MTLEIVKQKGRLSGDYYALKFGDFCFRLSDHDYTRFIRECGFDPETIDHTDPRIFTRLWKLCTTQ